MFTNGNKNWGKEPNPGELNQMIEIVSPVSEINENGYPVTHDEPVCRATARTRRRTPTRRPAR